MASVKQNAIAKHTGNICESLVLYRFLQQGWIVSKPFGDNARYDLIVERDGKLFRVQIKSANRPKEKDGQVIRIMLESKNTKGPVPYTAKEIDVFVAVDKQEEKIYWIPIEVTNKQRAINLRLTGGARAKLKSYRWAKDYELGTS